VTPSDPESPDPDQLGEESRESIEKVRWMFLPDDDSPGGEEPPLVKASKIADS
jgi:hypothetical protein